MTAPSFRSVEQQSGDVERPSAFFAAMTAADGRVAELAKLRTDLTNARHELDDTMQALRDLGALVASLTTETARWHADRDEQRERADEWRDKAESYLATIDELQAEVRDLRADLEARAL